MGTVSIASTAYQVYGDVAAADIYLGGSLTAEAWRDADADTKARALVSATRWIDAQGWRGERAVDDQPLAWPRSGIDGVSDGEVPAPIINAAYELAAALADDPDHRASFAAVAAKRIKAGSVEIENFRGSSVQTTTAFPAPVMKLVGQWLAGGGTGGFGAPLSYDTGRESRMDEPFRFTTGL